MPRCGQSCAPERLAIELPRHDSRPLDDLYLKARRPHDPLELRTILLGQVNRLANSRQSYVRSPSSPN
jgi:hypothetical protein